MAMQETPKTLKLYFGLSGGLAAVLGIRNLVAGVVLPGIIALVLGGAYLYVAFLLDALLQENPGLIRMILYISSGILAIGLAANIYLQNAFGISQGIIGLLINWYLLVNVNRLAGQAKGTPPLPTAR
jgi:hypothetical protein